jgi:hypothetical protein
VTAAYFRAGHKALLAAYLGAHQNCIQFPAREGLCEFARSPEGAYRF